MNGLAQREGGAIPAVKTRAAIYARVSSDEQAERGTIENQRQFGAGYTRLHEIPVADWYLDDGVSGTIPLKERPEGARLVADARAGKFDTLLVYRIDRLGRRLLPLLQAVEELEGMGVTVRSMTEPFDTSTPIGRFVMSLLAMLAELERETIAERCDIGRRRVAGQGRRTGGPTTYGYRVIRQRLKVYEKEAAIVREIFDLYLRGWGYLKIADYLNGRGIPPPGKPHGKAGLWRASCIRFIIGNETYTGCAVWGRTSRKGEVIPQECPPIADKETFAKAQAQRQENRHRPNGRQSRLYLLTRLLRCEECGQHYSGSLIKNRPWYRCMGGIGPHRCKSKALAAEAVEAAVWDAVKGIVNDPDSVIEVMRERREEQASSREEIEAMLREYTGALKVKEHERNRIVTLFRRGLINEGEVEAQLGEVDREAEALRRRYEEVFVQSQDAQAVETRFLDIHAALAQYQQYLESDVDAATKREIIGTLIQEIGVRCIGEGRKREPELMIRYHFGEEELASSAECRITKITSATALPGACASARASALRG